MKNFPLIGLGIATKGSSGNTLDTFFPCISFKNIEDEFQNNEKIADPNPDSAREVRYL